MSSVLLPSQLDVTKLHYDRLKSLKSNAKKVPIRYEGVEEWRLQTPKSRVPFGLTENEDDTSGLKKYSLEISLGGSDNLEKFEELLKKMDKRNIEHISRCSQEFFGKPMSPEIIEQADKYKSLVKPDKKGQYPSRFKVKLPFYQGVPQFEVFDQDRSQVKFYTINEQGEVDVDWSWIRKGTQLIAIIECEGLWVVGSNVYCTWKAIGVKIFRNSRLKGYCFVEDVGDDLVEDEEDDQDIPPSSVYDSIIDDDGEGEKKDS